MLESLIKIFNRNNTEDSNIQINELNLLCGLMVEAANSDGKIDQEELDKISKVLTEIFKKDAAEVNKILSKEIKEKDEPKSLYFYTSKINKKFSPEKKFLLVETLWEIILADGKVHDFESNLIRRLAGLIYISDVNCGNAKKNALKKIQNTN